MAEKSAHLTLTTQASPSIFDYIAQEALNELLNPAGRKIAGTVCLKYPQTNFLLRWYDETFLLSSTIINYYYLKNYGGSFSECFYGLRRVCGKQPTATKLSRNEIYLSILTVVVVPYLRHKLNSKVEEIYLSDTSRKNKVRREAIIKLNSAIQIFYLISNFVQHLRYLSGQTHYNSPLLWLTGLKLTYQEIVEAPLSWKNLFPMIMQRGFEFGAFSLQCYHWWRNESHGVFGVLPVPPPPEISQDEAYPAGICPICWKPRQIDTVLSVSGLVFCFACIQQHIINHQCCPITKLPASFHDLIRLYPDDS